MARREDHLNLDRTNLELLPIIHKLIRRARRNPERQLKRRAIRPAKLGRIQRVHQHLRIWVSLDRNRVIGNMIEVPMREPHADQIPAAFFHFIQNLRDSVIRRIKQHGLLQATSSAMTKQSAVSAMHAGVHQNLRMRVFSGDQRDFAILAL